MQVVAVYVLIASTENNSIDPENSCRQMLGLETPTPSESSGVFRSTLF